MRWRVVYAFPYSFSKPVEEYVSLIIFFHGLHFDDTLTPIDFYSAALQKII